MGGTALMPIPAAMEATRTLRQAVLQEAATPLPVMAELLLAAKAMEDLIRHPLRLLEDPTEEEPMTW